MSDLPPKIIEFPGSSRDDYDWVSDVNLEPYEKRDDLPNRAEGIIKANIGKITDLRDKQDVRSREYAQYDKFITQYESGVHDVAFLMDVMQVVNDQAGSPNYLVSLLHHWDPMAVASRSRRDGIYRFFYDCIHFGLYTIGAVSDFIHEFIIDDESDEDPKTKSGVSQSVFFRRLVGLYRVHQRSNKGRTEKNKVINFPKRQ